jgi:hypothetical protein
MYEISALEVDIEAIAKNQLKEVFKLALGVGAKQTSFLSWSLQRSVVVSADTRFNVILNEFEDFKSANWIEEHGPHPR